MLKVCARFLIILCAIATSSVLAQSDTDPAPIRFAQYWNADLAFTYLNWDSLGDLEPAGRGGPFETTGVGWDATIEASVARVGSAIMFVGFNLGVSGFNSDIFLEEGDVASESGLDLTYAVGTLNFRFGNPGERYFDVDLGLGGYNAGNMYIDCAAIPAASCSGSAANSAAFGGYLGGSWAVWRGLKLAGRVHYADFGTIPSIGPDSGELKGPIYTLSLGWEFGDWRR